MSRRNPSSVRFWFVAAFFTIGALLAPCDAQRTTMDQPAFHVDAPALAANQYVGAPGTESFVPAHMRHAAHALPRTSYLATLPPSVMIASPHFSREVLSRENVVALGGVSRSTAPSRAPPAA
jgi:hypothetical protein